MKRSKDWYSCSELAGLPGVPRTRPGVRRIGVRLGWKSRITSARGGKRVEFHVSSLPDKTQELLSCSNSASHEEVETKGKGSQVSLGCDSLNCDGSKVGFRLRVSPGSSVEILLPSSVLVLVEGVLP